MSNISNASKHNANYRYRWWMDEKRAFLTIRAKLYYITKFEYLEPEIKAFKKYIRK